MERLAELHLKLLKKIKIQLRPPVSLNIASILREDMARKAVGGLADAGGMAHPILG